jgi:hypothetical protein
LFVVNSGAGRIEVLDLAEPSDPTREAVLDAAGDVDAVRAAAVFDVAGGLVAVAVERDPAQEPGAIALYDADSLDLSDVVEVGALPNKVTITPNGEYVLSANEGEPNFDEPAGERTDPMGVGERHRRARGSRGGDRRNPLVRGVRRRRREPSRGRSQSHGASAEDDDPKPSTDFEPEYVTVTPDSGTAFVSLQENNAIATVNIPNAEITGVSGLGSKDFSIPGNELDTSDADLAAANGDDGEVSDTISLQNWPIRGLYQPDAIATHGVARETFVLTANEDDARDFEVATVSDLTLAEDAFARACRKTPSSRASLTSKPSRTWAIWKSRTSWATPTTTGSSRSSIRSVRARFRSGRLPTTVSTWCFDNGNDFERIYAEQFPAGLQNSTESGPKPNRSNSVGSEIGPSRSSASSAARAYSSTT